MSPRLPSWFRRPLPPRAEGGRVKALLEQLDLHTVCEGAQCPNRTACWHEGTAAFLILGSHCTRDCRFCAIPHHAAPDAPDADEPAHLAEAAQAMGLRHVVITSVTRDDLPDGGAGHFSTTIGEIRQRLPETTVEVLIPDFQGNTSQLDVVLDAAPDILNHNLETVKRLHPIVRPQGSYMNSLSILRHAAQQGARTKSGLMLGMGETETEVRSALQDLRDAGVTILTLGQYLAPSADHHPIDRFVTPAEFDRWRETALTLGFTSVASAPEVRSSYHAEELMTARSAS